MITVVNVLCIQEGKSFIGIGGSNLDPSGQISVVTQNSYGYGDIIRMIAYCTEIQRLVGKQIKPKFLVLPSEKHLVKNIHHVLSHFNLEIEYEIEIDTLESYKDHYTNLLHVKNAKIVRKNLGVPKLKTKKPSMELDYIAVWNPYAMFDDIPKVKMPIPKIEFENLISKYNVKFVNYDMHPNEAFDIIRKAKFCVGYEGIGQAIAYSYGKKLITMSLWKDVSINTGGPSSVIVDNINDLKEIINEYSTC